MSSAAFEIIMSKELINDLQNFGNEIAKNIAINVRNSLCDEYAYAVEQFYDSYTPEQYERKWQMRRSYRPYYKNPHKTRVHGGVEITPDRMKDVHAISNYDIISYSISGFHGHPKMGIWTPPSIYEHITEYRDILFNHIEDIAEDAISKAKTKKYRILHF